MARQRQSGFNFQYTQCESRQLLATISLIGGELLIGGGSAADVSTVSVAGSTLTATLTGLDTETFPVADVDSIRFVGLGGNDRFTNLTSIDSFAFGQSGNDILIGGDGNDRLVGGTGDDELIGNGGDDEIRGGADGTKEIDGGPGNDKLFGGTGINTIRGGEGNDTVYGGDLLDTVFGGDGDDFIYPGHGENVVRAGNGNDTVISGVDADSIFGDAGNDRLYGGEGDDEIDGGAGNDSVIGRLGNDTLKGGIGDDYLRGNDGNDVLEGQGGDDRLQGDRGDDSLSGGSNSASGFDRVLLDGIEGRYRIAGSDLFSRDRIGDDGTDDLDGMEWIHFIDVAQPAAHAAVSQIEESVVVQPIIVSNTNGTNTAEFFGTAEEEKEIKNLINDIWYQARIQVNWLSTNTWNNTFANVGNGGTRPFNDAFTIFDIGAGAGVTSSGSLNINMFFIEIVPGSANLTENTTNGASLDSNNGVTFQVGDALPGFEDGRKAVARVASHEIAHNLGLTHISSATNLMNFPIITGSNISPSQAATLISSKYSR